MKLNDAQTGGQKVLYLETVQDSMARLNEPKTDEENLIGIIMSYFVQGRGTSQSYFHSPEEMLREIGRCLPKTVNK